MRGPRYLLSPIWPAMIAILLLSSGCEERDGLWSRSLRIEGPMISGTQMVWLDRTTSRLVILDTDVDGPAFRVGLSPRPRGFAIAGGRALVVGGSGNEPVLDLVLLGDDYPTVSVPLEEAYERVFVAPGDRHAVLIHSMSGETIGGPAARNLNRIAVASIGGTPAVTELLLQTESLAPREVVFSADGSLAAVILDAAIALVDLENPARHVRIPLRLPGGQRLLPREAIFSPNADYLYVRASGTPDLLVLEIENDALFSATVNFLFVPGAASLEAIAVPEDNGLEQHVAALFRRTGDSVATLLHATGDASLSTQAILSRPATRLTDIGGGCMLVHGVGGSSGFSRWVAAWEIETGRVDEREVQGEYSIDPVVAGGRAYFRHDAVSIPDVGTVPALTGVHVDTSGAWLRLRAGAVVLLGKSSAAATGTGDAYLVAVDIPRHESGAASNQRGLMIGMTGALVTIKGEMMSIDGVVLDDSIQEIGLVGDYIFAVHDKKVGDLTLVPSGELSRESARRHDGIFLTGLLDTLEEGR